MPLPLTVSCFSKIQIGFFTFLVPAHRVVPDKGPLNGCVCVCADVTKTITDNRQNKYKQCMFVLLQWWISNKATMPSHNNIDTSLKLLHAKSSYYWDRWLFTVLAEVNSHHNRQYGQKQQQQPFIAIIQISLCYLTPKVTNWRLCCSKLLLPAWRQLVYIGIMEKTPEFSVVQ